MKNGHKQKLEQKEGLDMNCDFIISQLNAW